MSPALLFGRGALSDDCVGHKTTCRLRMQPRDVGRTPGDNRAKYYIYRVFLINPRTSALYRVCRRGQPSDVQFFCGVLVRYRHRRYEFLCWNK